LALEDPLGYQLSTKKPSKHAMRTLAILAEMMTNLAKGSDKLIKEIPLDQAEREDYLNRVQLWAQGEQKMELRDIDYTIDWNKERQAFMNLTDFIIENEDAIESDLKMVDLGSHPTISFKFGINELMDSLEPPSLPDDKRTLIHTMSKALNTSSEPALQSPNSRSSLQGGLGPGDVKKSKILKSLQSKTKKKKQ